MLQTVLGSGFASANSISNYLDSVLGGKRLTGWSRVDYITVTVLLERCSLRMTEQS